jgi:hypothetical protein
MTRRKSRVSPETLEILRQMWNEQTRLRDPKGVTMTSRDKLSQMIAEDRANALEEAIQALDP